MERFFQYNDERKKLIDISLEKVEDETTFFVGKIKSARKDFLELQEVDALGNYKHRITKLYYKDITLVSFANRYSELLDKYSQQKARYAGTSCYAIHETEGGIYFCNLGFNIYDNILMINIPKYDRIDLRQIAYLEEHIKIWKNGTCTLNIEKRQGKSRFEVTVCQEGRNQGTCHPAIGMGAAGN